jgi:hypothetical protein
MHLQDYFNQTPTQKTKNGGYHLLFTVAEEQMKHLPVSRTGLLLDGVLYNVDVKFKNFESNSPQYLNCEPTPGYKWINWNFNRIADLPDSLFEIISDQTTIGVKKLQMRHRSETSASSESEVDDDDVEIAVETTGDQLYDDVRLLLECISSSNVSNYDEWLRIGIFLYCINPGMKYLELWERASSRSKKFYDDVTKCKSEWQYFEKKGYEGNRYPNLFYYVKERHPKKFNQIYNHLNNRLLGTKFEDILCNGNHYEITKINTKYLTEDATFMENVDRFVSDEEMKSLCVKSIYGSGKTYFLRENLLVKHANQFKRVLFLTYRRSLTRDIFHYLQELGFDSYMDVLHLERSNKLICQYESVKRLFRYNDFFLDDITYDLVIIDEAKSFFIHTFAPTHQGQSECNFVNVFQICQNSSKLVFLDGDNDSQVYYNASLFGKSIIIENEFNENDRHMKIHSDRIAYEALIDEHLDQNKKVVIVCQSSNEVVSQYTRLKEKYEAKAMKHYTGDNNTKDRIEELNDICKAWSELDVLIYSPTIESGCNMDVRDVFDTLFVIFSDGANSQRSLFQQMGRVRYFKEKVIHMLNDNKFPINDNRNYWTYQQVMNTVNHIQKQRVIMNGQVQIIQNTEFTTNFVYQKVEELNKCKNLYMNLFIDLAQSKNYTVEILAETSQKVDKVNYALEDVVALDITPYSENAKTKRLVEQLEKARNPMNISEIQEMLKEERKNELSKRLETIKTAIKAEEITDVKDRVFATKMYYMDLLGLDQIETASDIKAFFKKQHLLYNYVKITDEDLVVEDDGTMNILQLTSDYKMNLVRNIIKGIGFTGIHDDKMILREELSPAILKLFEEGGILRDVECVDTLFTLDKTLVNMTTSSHKARLAYINKILNRYCLNLSSEKKTIRSATQYFYKLDHINDVKRIVDRKKKAKLSKNEEITANLDKMI